MSTPPQDRQRNGRRYPSLENQARCSAAHRDRPRGDAVTVHEVRREWRRRWRAYDRAGGASERGGGRAGAAWRYIAELPMTPERLATLVEAAPRRPRRGRSSVTYDVAISGD